jgi:mannitol/fructose-specific phosphotransferase system IIA component (Ntr-type)
MSSATLKVSDCLTEKQVLILPAELPKEKMYEKLVASLNLPDAKLALKAILDREQWGSTEIRPGLALSHARIPGITKVAAAMGVCPGKIFVLYLGPADQPQESLAFLASVSALFKPKELAESFLALKTPAAFLAKIRDSEIS